MSDDPNAQGGHRWVAGVDGYRHGWVVVLAAPRMGVHSARVVATFLEVLSLPERPDVIAVDVPIGLLSVAKSGGRACERSSLPSGMRTPIRFQEHL
jgi:predicted RNase H-like nuclease